MSLPAEPAACDALPPPSAVPEAPEKPRRHRWHVDHFRTSDAEHAELGVRAREAGLSVDAYCRRCCLGHEGPRSRRPRPTVESKKLAGLLAELNRIGVNLNQVARGLNMLLAIAQHMDAERLEEITGNALEQQRPLAVELERALAVTRAALGYDSQG